MKKSDNLSNLLEEAKKLAEEVDVVTAEVELTKINWYLTRHDYQIMPEGNWWNIWLFLAGRGAGKTRTASENIWRLAWEQPKTRWLVSAPTFADVKDVCLSLIHI